MRSVQRILAVFESFDAERTSLTLQEIAVRIDLPKSTAFRIVHSLERAGYLVRLENMTYGLSFRFVRLAGHVRSTMDIRDIARPMLAALAAATGETCSIHTIVGRERVCLDAVTAAAPLRSVVQPGEHVPLGGGSATKVLLAYLPEPDRGPLIAAVAASGGRDASVLRAELSRIREVGYAVSHGERLPGVSAISVPIHGIDDAVRHCLSVGGPSFRIAMREPDLIREALAAAGTVSSQFGGKPAAAGRDARAEEAPEDEATEEGAPEAGDLV